MIKYTTGEQIPLWASNSAQIKCASNDGLKKYLKRNKL